MIRLGPLRLAVDVHVEDPVLTSLLSDLLGDLSRTAPVSGPHIDVVVRGTGPWHVRSAARTAVEDTLHGVLAQTLTAINLSVVSRTPLLAFHAAVVSRGGRTLVLPGRSGAGKSTLTACLLRHGWAYVSDEALALDAASGELVAYPRPLALSAWSCSAAGVAAGPAVGQEAAFRARDLGAAVDMWPAAVSWVVLLARRAGPGPPDFVTDSRNAALHELMSRGFTAHRDGGGALAAAAALLRSSQVLRLLLDDPWAAAALLTELSDTSEPLADSPP